MIRVVMSMALGTAVSCGASADSFFLGFDNNVTGAIPMASTPSSDGARDAFVGALVGDALTLDFESLSNGAVPSSFSFGSGVEAAVSDLHGAQIRNTQLNAAYGIDSSRFLYAEPGDGETCFTLTFNTPLTAVGFYHTDATDWTGTAGIPHLKVNLGGEPEYDLIEGILTSDIQNGSVGYFSIIAETPFTTLTVYRVPGGGSTDAVGFDLMTVVPVPAPAGVALLGIATLATRRRR